MTQPGEATDQTGLWQRWRKDPIAQFNKLAAWQKIGIGCVALSVVGAIAAWRGYSIPIWGKAQLAQTHSIKVADPSLTMPTMDKVEHVAVQKGVSSSAIDNAAPSTTSLPNTATKDIRIATSFSNRPGGVGPGDIR